MELWNKVTSIENLKNAWESVRAKGSCAGIDKVTVESYEKNWEINLKNLQLELLDNRYRVLPVMRIKLPFFESSDRPLAVPSVRDRIVMRALSNVLVPIFENKFYDCNYSYRPHRSANQAANKVNELIKSGMNYFFKSDIEKFFENIDHDILIEKLKIYIEDEAVLHLIKKLIRAQVFDHMIIIESLEGLHQGSPLSPLLSNIYLMSFDEEITKKGYKMIRYCDDFLILSLFEKDLSEIEIFASEVLSNLKLKLKEKKTFKGELKDGFVFLGYYFDEKGKSVSKKSLEALKYQLKELSLRKEDSIDKIEASFRGWKNYYDEKLNINIFDTPETILALLKSNSFDIETLSENRLKTKDVRTPWLHAYLSDEWYRYNNTELAMKDGFLAIKLLEKYDENIIDIVAKSLNTELESIKILYELINKYNGKIDSISEKLFELGYFKLAKDLYDFSFEELDEEIDNSENINELVKFDNNDLEKYLEFFEGRTSVHGLETISRRGQRSFITITKPFQKNDLIKHIEGKKTCGIYIFREDSTVKLMVLDIDISSQVINDNFEDKLNLALQTTVKLSKKAREMGLFNIIEFSGYKGYHIWFFFENSILGSDARKLALNIISNCEKVPDGINIEIFPKRDSLKDKTFGSLIKLPLGKHSKSGNICYFSDNEGKPFPDQKKVLNSLKKINNDELEKALLIPEKSISKENKDENILENYPMIENLSKECEVIDFIIKKAKNTSYLNNAERLLLLGTVGHLGQQGEDALHTIISQCFNYSSKITQRHINKKFRSPMSCPKIREIHKQTTCMLNCNCKFKNLGHGIYPTPILHVLKPNQIEIFSKKVKSETITNSKTKISDNKITNLDSSKKDSYTSLIEEYAQKLANLKRQERGVLKSIENCNKFLNETFDQLGVEEYELKSGLLVRSKDSEGNTNWRIEL